MDGVQKCYNDEKGNIYRCQIMWHLSGPVRYPVILIGYKLIGSYHFLLMRLYVSCHLFRNLEGDLELGCKPSTRDSERIAETDNRYKKGLWRLHKSSNKYLIKTKFSTSNSTCICLVQVSHRLHEYNNASFSTINGNTIRSRL